MLIRGMLPIDNVLFEAFDINIAVWEERRRDGRVNAFEARRDASPGQERGTMMAGYLRNNIV